MSIRWRTNVLSHHGYSNLSAAHGAFDGRHEAGHPGFRHLVLYSQEISNYPVLTCTRSSTMAEVVYLPDGRGTSQTRVEALGKVYAAVFWQLARCMRREERRCAFQLLCALTSRRRLIGYGSRNIDTT